MTPEYVTPEQARELLDRVKEGCPLPWEIFTTETIERDPREVKNVRCNDPDYDGHLAYSMDYDGTTEIDPDAIELIAAAPALAELVANLRFEYAVQNAVTGAWLRAEGDGVVVRTSDPFAADWSTNFEEVEAYAVWMTGEELTEHRVMARLTSTPEVVE